VDLLLDYRFAYGWPSCELAKLLGSLAAGGPELQLALLRHGGLLDALLGRVEFEFLSALDTGLEDSLNAYGGLLQTLVRRRGCWGWGCSGWEAACCAACLGCA
jgi:hypothetical protein